VSQVRTIATAEPSIAPPPMVRHLVEMDDDGNKDSTMCGHVWDRLLAITPGPVCSDCIEAIRKKHGGGA
jgi:hypothetical protein